MARKRVRAAVTAVMASALLLSGTVAMATTGTATTGTGPAGERQTQQQTLAKLSHSAATAKFQSAGLTWSSSGGCSDRNNSTCTSFDQINSATVDGVITLKQSSRCAVNLTGGTETGHADGTYSHWNGYKVDFSLSSCLDNYIQGTFTSIGGSKWKSGSGNIYYREGNHWDVTYHNCGGC